MNRLEQILARLTEIRSALAGTGPVDVAALQTEVNDLNTERTQIEQRNALLAGLQLPGASSIPQPGAAGAGAAAAVEDRFATMEYRSAFMEFAKTGVMPAAFTGQEFRANAVTNTTDASAVVPTTILNEVIKKMEVRGSIFAGVRKLNIQGGVEVPILTLKPKATWIGENQVSDRQKVGMNQNVSFSYYGLECRVAISLLTSVVTLAMFEAQISDLIAEAMLIALEAAILRGTGTGQPLGLLVDTRVPAANKVDLTEAEAGTWAAWKKEVFAKIPLAYRSGGSFFMAAGTFETYIDGMTDQQGQPIGRVNAGITEGPQERFAGKPVQLVEDDVIAPFDAAAAGDVIAVFARLSDYAINSNLQLQMFRWFDHETNQWVDKAILIADGKILDPNGVIIIRKAATV
ncbi:phage major capsid protein [Paenibacillus glycanilyticus]|uniref:phage major capsid protein n=1 Tax=Paenibacillus glycanilyticus TaxID=126569 RepID=UPI00190FEF79|nr:phage major capsid protein [Paenibacillus glycanilyticus]